MVPFEGIYWPQLRPCHHWQPYRWPALALLLSLELSLAPALSLTRSRPRRPFLQPERHGPADRLSRFANMIKTDRHFRLFVFALYRALVLLLAPCIDAAELIPLSQIHMCALPSCAHVRGGSKIFRSARLRRCVRNQYITPPTALR